VGISDLTTGKLKHQIFMEKKTHKGTAFTMSWPFWVLFPLH